MRPSGPRVLTIPPGVPFLPTLADALLDGSLAGQTPLADVRLYLPSRRAARAFADILGRRNGGRALLLPRLVALGEAFEAGETEGSFGDGLEGLDAAAPPIAPLERRLVLTRLVQAWSAEVGREMRRLSPGSTFRVPASPADAVALAGDLETLMDALAAEEVSWDGLGGAVEAEYSHYFELTARFLRIAAENWPKILAERGFTDPAQRRVAVLRAEADRLGRERPGTPVIAAGSVGALPATAALLAAVAGLPRGAVVLPGLDADLDEVGWAAIGPDDGGEVHGHPQAAMRRFLASLPLERSRVSTLRTPGEQARARAKMLSNALRPAETTDRWADLPPDERRTLADEGTAGLSVVEAADEREEALAAAVALRETLERPGRTAVLITPDRGLAARVAVELARWGVAAADAAAIPLADTPTGRLARLAADAALGDHPARIPALLAHPDLRLGLSRALMERGASALEIGALRAAPAQTLDGLARALAAGRADAGRFAPRPRRRLAPEDWDLAALLLGRLAKAFGGFGAATARMARLRPITPASPARTVARWTPCASRRSARSPGRRTTPRRRWPPCSTTWPPPAPSAAARPTTPPSSPRSPVSG
jgi:ATP-dependent helicase/nuclease subunit B